MKKLIEYINKVESKKRSLIARYLIIVGIFLVYSPYWVKLFLDSGSGANVADTIVFFGWWVLTPGLILYFLNIWLNYKAEKAHSNTSD